MQKVTKAADEVDDDIANNRVTLATIMAGLA